jgi:membrane fusion protein (multidrug efflux system)
MPGTKQWNPSMLRPAPAILVTLLLAIPGALQAAPAMPPPSVIVETVGPSQISDPLEALGTLRANETVEITANVSDTVSRIHFEDGQKVEQGQLLVEMTDAEEHALLQEARSTAEEAQRQYERLKKLVAEGTAAESLLDERRREAQTAEARLNAVQSRLQDRIITAPFSGTMGLRNVSPGALVAPGDVISTLVDDSSMKLDFTIPSLYLTSVDRSTLIEATTPVYPDRVFAGEVTSVDNTINPVTRSVIVRARIPNDDRALKPGMLMTLKLQRALRQALVISEEAVIPQGRQTFVMVVNTDAEPPTAQRREIQLGARLPGRVEVISGLAEGETIVTHGAMKTRPGAPVRIGAVDDGDAPVADLIKPDDRAKGASG